MAHKSSKKETHYSKSEKPPRKSAASGPGRPTRSSSDKPYGSRDDGGKKPFRSRDEGSGGNGDRPAYKKRDTGDAKPYGSRGNSSDRPSRPRRDDHNEARPQRSSNNDRPYQKRDDGNDTRPQRSNNDRPYQKRDDNNGGERPFRPRREDGDRPYSKRDAGGGDKPYRSREKGDGPQRKPYGDKPSFQKKEEKSDGWEGRSYGEKKILGLINKKEAPPQRGNDGDRPYQKRTENGDRPPRKAYGDKPAYEGGKRPYTKKEDGEGGNSEQRPYRKPVGEKKPFRKGKPGGEFHSESPTGRKRVTRASEGDERRERASRTYNKRTKFDREDIWQGDDEEGSGKWDEHAKDGPMTLNKYLAHAGVSSRREAAAMVKDGKVQVNGEVITTPSYRVQDKDVITLDGKTMTPQRHHVYILMNKPKDFITTTEDDKGRRTVMDLVASAGIDKLYPVGRLDRNTTGVLLLTNDGDLAQKLSHPSYDTKKIYQVTLDKNVTKVDFDKILDGVVLEDGKADVDRISYLENKNEIGLEIHSGRNRIVRRIFEHLGYEVEKLDRVMYAGLTKKNVSRGKWRFLNDKEITFLKHFKTR